MLDGIEWLERCVKLLPPRRCVVPLGNKFIQFDTSTRRGVIGFQKIPDDIDTVLCVNIFNSNRSCKDICKHAYEILPPDGVIIITCTDIHPGVVRFSLRLFDWKYITMVPDSGHTFAIAGKGERPFSLVKINERP